MLSHNDEFQAAWAHVALAAIHPFADGNGRAARVLASLAMYLGGFRRVEFTSLEESWGSHLRDYYQAFRCLGSEFDPACDVTPFIEAHVQAQVTQVRALRMAERVQSEMWTGLVNLCEEGHLEPRFAEGLWEVLFERRLTAGYYRSITGVSPATVTNDLGRMVAAGHLAPHGAAGGRWYGAGPRLVERLAVVRRLAAPAAARRSGARDVRRGGADGGRGARGDRPSGLLPPRRVGRHGAAVGARRLSRPRN